MYNEKALQLHCMLRGFQEVMSDFHTVCRVSEVAPGEGKTVVVGGKLIALFFVNGQYHAIDDTCPHMGASLSGGYLQDGIVTCPWHAWRYRLADGAWVDNPKLKIGCYAVRVEGDQIQIEAPPKPERTP
jgi:nitrite reductase (NADH) small subunit/3-phenylpropionate/trans-cinnamate dioxygenase ferredoxin subunit